MAMTQVGTQSSDIKKCKKLGVGSEVVAGQTALELRALTSLAEDQILFPGDWKLPSGLHGQCMHMVHLHICRQNIPTHKININKFARHSAACL